MTRPTSVYVMTCQGRTKIGISNNPEQRRRGMETAAGLPVALIHSRQFKTKNAAWLVEQSLHRLFQEARTMGEWFAITADQAATALDGEREPAPPEPTDGAVVILPTVTEQALAMLAGIIERDKAKRRAER